MDDKIAKEITHDEYIKMLNTVHDCGKWSNKLRDGIGGRFVFFPTVSVSKDFLKEMREAARKEGTQKHIDVLNEVFGKEEPQPKFKVGDWVVARGEDKAGQVTICFEHGVATKKCNSYPFNSYHVIENLRPATKEEVEKAKGEGDLFFTEEGVEALANLIYQSTYRDSINWYRLPGKNKNEKAEWINKTITKALKDEGLW